MSNSKSNEKEEKKEEGNNAEESDEDESEILEESPCGRWSKRRQEVQQRDVPGIEGAFLAIDTEEGMEVVWNEVRISPRRNVKDQENKFEEVFENLIQINHPNIVKLHKYWIDDKNDKKRMVFITEYMSSGSLKKFLKLTKRNVKKLPLQSWKRWCSQILSALSYLHSSSPPIIHGNLNTDSIFIQQNGLVKIGSVAPDAIGTHVKTFQGDMKNMHFIAPEYGNPSPVTPAADIYSFGMCALEMAALEISGNGDSGVKVTRELISKTIDSLGHDGQKDLIRQCLNPDPLKRPESSKLLFHPVLFEVQPLKFLVAHHLVHISKPSKQREALLEEMINRLKDDFDIAEVKKSSKTTMIRRSDVSGAEKLNSYLEEVRKEYHKHGLYPLTPDKFPALVKKRPVSPENKALPVEEPEFKEKRRIANMMCSMRSTDDGYYLTLSLRMEDKMNRQLNCNFVNDSPSVLSYELVNHGFINEADRETVAATIEAEMNRIKMVPPMNEVIGSPTLETPTGER